MESRLAPQLYIEYIYFLIISIVIVFILTFYVLTQRGGSGRKEVEELSEKKGMGKGEKIWLYFLFIILVLGNVIIFSPLLPSSRYTFWLEAEPVLKISIEMRNYEFILSEKPITIPAGVPVEFIVKSHDLLYGFGVFRKDGLMVFQMQVVPPPYVNRIIWIFDEPGYYDIRSTEYSGPKHPYLFVPDAINVVRG